MLTRWFIRPQEFFYDDHGFNLAAVGYAVDEHTLQGQLPDPVPVTCISKIPFKTENPNLQINDVLDVKNAVQKNNNSEIEIRHDSTIDVFARNNVLQVPIIRLFEKKVGDVLNVPTAMTPIIVKHPEKSTMNVFAKEIPDNIGYENADRLMDRPGSL